jgi:hypothetical protein
LYKLFNEFKQKFTYNINQMIILNKDVTSKNKTDISVIDMNDCVSTNSYYSMVWKEKYGVILEHNSRIQQKSNSFESNLIKYLKGEKPFIE